MYGKYVWKNHLEQKTILHAWGVSKRMNNINVKKANACIKQVILSINRINRL